MQERLSKTSLLNMKKKALIERLDGVNAVYNRFIKIEELGWNDLLPGTFMLARNHMEFLKENYDLIKYNKERFDQIMQMYRYMFLKSKKNKNIKNFIIFAFPRFYFMIKCLCYRLQKFRYREN